MEEAAEPVDEDDEKQDRLLARHRHAGDLLVGERRQPPHTRARVDVEPVHGPRQQREEEAERRREHERRERVPGARARGEPARDVLHERPPHQHARREVARVLEVEQPALLAQCRLVDVRHVPEEVVREPQRQRHRRQRQQAPQPEPRERAGHRSGHAEHREQRRPLGEDHVLQKVCGQQVVEAEVVQRRPERDREKQQRRRVTRDLATRRTEPPDREQVQQRERRDDDGRVDVGLPGVR